MAKIQQQWQISSNNGKYPAAMANIQQRRLNPGIKG